MNIPKFDTDLAFISKLGDSPNTDDNMSAEDLKEEFDKAAVLIQQFINNYIIPALNGNSSDLSGFLSLAGGTMKGNINMGNNAVTGLKSPTDKTDAATKAYVDDSVPSIIPVSKGGTGATTAADARTNLGAAASVHKHSADDINSGTLAAARLPVVPISKGGTGATNIADAWANLGVPSLGEVFNIAKVGTQIPAEADMDAYKTPGNFMSNERAISVTLNNAPFTSTGFRLLVVEGYGGRTYQFAMSISNEIKWRVYNVNTWYDWSSSVHPTLTQLLGAGYMVASSYQIVSSVDEIPSDAPVNSVFLVPME